MAGRVRSVVGAVVFRRPEHSFECLGCGCMVPVHRVVAENPEAYVQQLESVERKHRICWRYATQREARWARAERARAERLRQEEKRMPQRKKAWWEAWR